MIIRYKVYSSGYRPFIRQGTSDQFWVSGYVSEIDKCKAQVAGNSGTMSKICNAAIVDFRRIDAIHELIRGSLCGDDRKTG